METSNPQNPAPMPAQTAIPQQPQVAQPANTVPPTSTAPQAIVSEPSTPKKLKLWIIILVLVVIVALVVAAGYFYMQREVELPFNNDVSKTQTQSVDDELQRDLSAADAQDFSDDLPEIDQDLQGL